MGIQDFQTFLDSNCVPGGAVTVDLLKIARQVIQRQRNRLNKAQSLHSPLLRLVLDAECCLDRLYGGYFSDWACGGQWNRMLQFLAILIQATELSGADLVVFFNGCNEVPRRSEWIQQQLQMRNKVNNVLKHIATKGTPPPKIWWTPPVCLRTSLRMALRHLKVSVMCSMDDHHQEVIAYCRENNFNGLVADDGEYAAFDPPRYFSSEQLKLTYKGSLDTKEYLMSEVNKSLGIPSDRLCILAALLGNYILTEQELTDFYKKLNINITGPNKTNIDQSIKLIATFVKDLPSTDKDVLAQKVFSSTSDPRCSKLHQSVQYYINGTKEGFLHYKTIKPTKGTHKPEKKNPVVNKQNSTEATTPDENCDMGTSRFASETAESERESLDAYNQATANAKAAPQIVIEPPGLQPQGDGDNVKTEEEQPATEPTVNGTTHNASNLSISSPSSNSSSSATSPSHPTTGQTKVIDKPISIPTTVPEVMRTASERHQKGLMSPHIYQILATGEIKLPVLLEDENQREFPSIHVIYRPVRQMVYAILFNLHHQIFMATKNKEKGDNEKIEVPDIVIKEWVWSKTNPFQTPELIKAEQIGWGVPTIQRLWFGTGIEDKRRRLRGFLTCMKSDTSLMLNISYVPQHLLVMACVLRYIMCFSDKTKILRRQELDAFIVQAFSPDLMNPQYLQDLQLPLVTFRGVQLATLLMAGVETALLANDACGAPIPWLMCCPWLFFDGKLFHHTLARAAVAKNLLELCGGHIDRVVKVERMRKAIIEGFNPVYARPPQPPIASNLIPGFRSLSLTPNGLSVNCALNDTQNRARINRPMNVLQRELIRRPVPSRGGQLEIAGVVVGQWGANYGQPGRIQGPQPLQGHLRGRLPQQVPFPRLNTRMFQPRGGNNSLATRGKKTQMKATSKKKSAVKKNQENDMKKDSKNRDNSVDEVNADAFSKLLVKDVNAKEKTESNQQKESAVNGGGKPAEKGQGDASLNVSQTVKDN